jgi:hypothetical protein
MIDFFSKITMMLFPSQIIANNNGCYIIFYTVVNYEPRGLMKSILELIGSDTMHPLNSMTCKLLVMFHY